MRDINIMVSVAETRKADDFDPGKHASSVGAQSERVANTVGDTLLLLVATETESTAHGVLSTVYAGANEPARAS